MSNFEEFLNDLQIEYPKPIGDNYISTKYGRPMRVTLKSKVVFGALWFRWEHQNTNDLQNEILYFTSGNREIDILKLQFDCIKEVVWY